MEMGNIISWGVKEGDEVTAGTILAEIETDKATLAFENQDEGFIAKILAPAGSKDVKVGQLVAVIVEDADQIPAFANFTADGGASSSSSGGTQQPAAAAAGAPAAAAPKQQRVKANFRIGPAARMALQEAGLTTDDVNPTGPNNIITKADVLAAVAAGVKPSGSAPAAAAAPAADKAPAAAQPAAAPKQQAPAAAKPAAAAAPPREGVTYDDIPNTQVRTSPATITQGTGIAASLQVTC
jgi:pyruvate dehydrogenase E2 component (dihydrolipoamide acetyltransferase)